MPVSAPGKLSTVLISLVLASCGNGGDDVPTKKPPPPAVKLPLVTATEAQVPEQLTLTGVLVADQRSEVTADTAGKVINVMIERGKRVKLGDPLIQLDVRQAALSAREAQANLRSARAQRSLAEEECKRAKTLLDKGAITRSEYDRQMTACTSALQQVSAAEARTAMIAKSVADGLVRAPFDGMIAEKMVTPGEWVAPGKPLLTLVDDDPLRIELSVPEVAIRAVRLDQAVKLTTVANPEKTYEAKITRVGAEIGRTRSLIVEATLEKAAAGTEHELVPGMFAEAKVTIGSTLRPVVPAEAVARRGKSYHAFVVVGGELHDRVVQLGPAPAPDQVSIIQGIAKGEKLVAKVTDQVVDGLRVQE